MRRGLIYLERLAVAVFGAFVMVALFFHDPKDGAFYPQCLFYNVTGLPCNGCGFLRATHSLLHGEMHQALSFNPLVFLASPLFALLAFRPSLVKSRFVVVCAIIISLTFFIARITGVFPLPTT